MLFGGTVMDIPFPIDDSGSSEDSTDLPYTILLTMVPLPLFPCLMTGLIPPPPITPSAADGDDSFSHLSIVLTLGSHLKHTHTRGPIPQGLPEST
jgi:hypothetical protein